MNPKINLAESTADARPAPSGITIIYEDRATGLRAKEFSDMLSASLGNGHPGEPACWRLELIDLPGLTDEVSRDASASEFLILSLRGDSHLTTATKQWLESWLECAPVEATCLIALFDPIRSVVGPHAEGARCYLRHVAAKAGVAFFAHCAVTPRQSSCELEADDGEPPVRSKPRRRRRNIVTPIFPTALTASFPPDAIAV